MSLDNLVFIHRPFEGRGVFNYFSSTVIAELLYILCFCKGWTLMKEVLSFPQHFRYVERMFDVCEHLQRTNWHKDEGCQKSFTECIIRVYWGYLIPHWFILRDIHPAKDEFLKMFQIWASCLRTLKCSDLRVASSFHVFWMEEMISPTNPDKPADRVTNLYIPTSLLRFHQSLGCD